MMASSLPVLLTLLLCVRLLGADVITHDYPVAMVSNSLIPISSFDDINFGTCSQMCRDEEGGLGAIKKTLETHGWVLIPGSEMRKYLTQFGATKEDLWLLESGYIHKKLPKDQVPEMAHRQNACHRMMLNTTDGEIFLADTHAITQIPKKEIASFREGTKINYQRSGTRYCTLPPHRYKRSSVSRALARISLFLSPDRHHPQENLNTDHEITIDDQILIRTTRKSEAEDIFSPTPEGIHQDNTELSSVILVGRYNITHGGQSRLWTLDAPTGNYDEDWFRSGAMNKYLILDHALEEPWEAIYFNDRKIKHEARAAYGAGRPGDRVRDVIVNFIRKPVKDGSDVFLERERIVHVI